MNAWNKRKERERDRKLDCILKNQIVIMEGLAKALYTYEHTARYGRDYIGPLEERAERTGCLVKCSICGKEGLKVVCVCPDCLKKAAVDPEQIQKLRQINNVLRITEDTDGNIKECVQSLTEILEDLERGRYGKE